MQDREAQKLPPVWLMGLVTLCNGALSGALAVTIPQLLAARGVPELQIASVTALGILPGTFSFVLAPVLDVGFSRRAYALVLGLLMAAFTALSFTCLSNLYLLTASMFAAFIANYLFTPAVAGWFGQLTARSDEPTLGAWLNVGSVAGFGGMSAAGIVLIRGLPYEAGVGAVCALGLSPLLILPFVPRGPPSKLDLRQSFAPLWRNLALVVRDRHFVRMLLLFAAPCASFALTNTLSGLGRDFHASEGFVGLIGGVGAAVGGVFGALCAPVLARRIRPLTLYMLIGAFGAAFTLGLLAPARTPLLFAAAMVGENVFQSAAFSILYTAALLSIGKDSPLASTQFALVSATGVVPITYMQFLDGKGYDLGGLTGSLLTDAGLSLAGCVVLATVFRLFWSDTLGAKTASAAA